MRRISKILAAVLVVALLAGFGTAFAATFAVPTAPLNTNDGVVKVVAARAGQIAPLILGADLVASTNLGASDGSFSGANAILGVFGSDINAKPDPWLYNYFYNLDKPDNQKVANATISQQQADGTAPPPEVIIAELTHRPDIILTQAEGTGDPDSTAQRFSGYVNVINDLPENTDSDPSNGYAPSFFTCSTSGLVIQTQNLIELAKAINTVAGAKNLKTRYGNPYDSAVNYDKYVWGYYFYIKQKLDSGELTKKSSAVLTNTADSGANWTLAARTTSTARPSSRLIEYVQDNTNLLNETLGVNSATLEQVLACDVVIATGNNGPILRTAAATAGIAEADLPVIINTLPLCLYGMVMQTHENALGIPLIQSIIYGDELGINPVYAAAYFYENFFHITDNNALQETVNTLMANATLPTGVTTSIAQYDPLAVEAIIAQGVAYGTGMPRHADTTLWAPDMSVALGAGKYANPNVYYPPYEPPKNTDDDKDNKDEDNDEDADNSLEETTLSFTDIDPSDVYYDAIKYVFDKKLMNGTSPSSFSPGSTSTRAMFATILYRLAGEPAVTGSSGFADVEDGKWFTDAIAWASENNIINGYGESRFGVNDSITREQIAVILFRYAQYKKLDTSASRELDGFDDAEDVSSWAVDAVEWIISIGVIEGRSDTTIAPQGQATRAELAIMLMRFIEFIENI